MLTWKGGLSNSGDMKDSPFCLALLLTSAPFVHPPSVPSLSLLLTVSLLYIQAQTVNANKAFSHTELMYPVHFTNVLPFKCHLLCCCREYISATGPFFFFFWMRVLGLNCLRLPLQSSYIDRHLMTLRFNSCCGPSLITGTFRPRSLVTFLPCQVDAGVKLLHLSLSWESQLEKKSSNEGQRTKKVKLYH